MELNQTTGLHIRYAKKYWFVWEGRGHWTVNYASI